MYLVAAISLFAAVLSWDLQSDYQKWLQTRRVLHTLEGWHRAGLLIPSGVCLMMFRDQYPVFQWWVPIEVIFLLGSWYWFLFDGIYNILRGFNFWFTGSNDQDDAHTDNFLQWLPRWGQITVKIACLVASIILYAYV